MGAVRSDYSACLHVATTWRHVSVQSSPHTRMWSTNRKANNYWKSGARRGSFGKWYLPDVNHSLHLCVCGPALLVIYQPLTGSVSRLWGSQTIMHPCHVVVGMTGSYHISNNISYPLLPVSYIDTSIAYTVQGNVCNSWRTVALWPAYPKTARYPGTRLWRWLQLVAADWEHPDH